MKNEYTHTFTVRLMLEGGKLPTTAADPRGNRPYLRKTELIAKDLGLSRAQFNRYFDSATGELNIGGIRIQLWPMGTDTRGRTRWAANEWARLEPALRDVLRDLRGAATSKKREDARARTKQGAGGRWVGMDDESGEKT